MKNKSLFIAFAFILFFAGCKHRTNKNLNENFLVTSRKEMNDIKNVYKTELAIITSSSPEELKRTKIREEILLKAEENRKNKGFWYRFFCGNPLVDIPFSTYKEQLFNLIRELKKDSTFIGKCNEQPYCDVAQDITTLATQLDAIHTIIIISTEYLQEQSALKSWQTTTTAALFISSALNRIR